GHSAKAYRGEIRRLFNFRVASVQDSEEMVTWLIEEILPDEQKNEAIRELVYQRFRELQIEPPTRGRVERLIRSAVAKYETNFAEQTLNKLTPEMTEQIDILLSTEEMESDESVEQSGTKNKMSDFAFLKTDPGAVGLGSFLTEIDKLKRIRAVGLPTNLFEGRSPKLVKTYRHRTATETPYLLRVLNGSHSKIE
ncbi:MAG: Tn3 family transposase, partial [Cyanobacteria bacterium J06648_1]